MKTKETQNGVYLSQSDLTVLITVYHFVHHCPKWVTVDSVDLRNVLLKVIPMNELDETLDKLKVNGFIDWAGNPEGGNISITDKGLRYCLRFIGLG